VADQIQRELAQLLRDEVKDPRVGRVTITAVEVSPDLSHAKVRFSQLSGHEHAREAEQALARTASFLRRELSHRLGLYSVPQLHFVYDDSIESGMRLSQLIDAAVASDRKPPE
jgi:ribosome-binding factor A